MLLRESIRPCTTCNDITPHAIRVATPAQLLAISSIVGAAWCFFQTPNWWVLGTFLLLLTLPPVVRGRAHLARVTCERCRGKRRVERRKHAPSLDGSTEIHIA